MDKKELQKSLKPIVKECIKEVLFEEGVLSTIVSEIAVGLGANQQVIAEPVRQQAPQRDRTEEVAAMKQKMAETRNGLMEAIGKDAYGGIDLFEGTTPTPGGGQGTQHSPLSGQDPNDPGVDISSLVNMKGAVWNKLK